MAASRYWFVAIESGGVHTIMRKRVFMSIGGVLLCGISVGMFKTAAFGVDPFQALMSGIQAVVPIRFGTLYMLVNACLLLFALFMDRHYIGIATLCNLTLLGYVTEGTQFLLNSVFPQPFLSVRILLLAVGIILNCLAAAFYFSADLGVSTYDAISLIVTYSWKVGQFKYNRIISDICCVVLGAGLCIAGSGLAGIGSAVGIGTVITMFFMGPLIEWFRVHMTDRMACS